MIRSVLLLLLLTGCGLRCGLLCGEVQPIDPELLHESLHMFDRAPQIVCERYGGQLVCQQR